MDLIFLAGRLLYGGYFILSGINHFRHLDMMTGYARSKNVPAPKAAVTIGGLFILLGGLGILLGMFVQWSVALIVIFLVLASLMMHNYWADKDQQAKMSNMINFMKNMALIGAALMILSIPGF